MRLVPGQIDARKTKPTFTKRQEFHKDVKKKHPRKNLGRSQEQKGSDILAETTSGNLNISCSSCCSKIFFPVPCPKDGGTWIWCWSHERLFCLTNFGELPCCSREKQGIWLQHNCVREPLAMLLFDSVAVRWQLSPKAHEPCSSSRAFAQA